MSSPVPPSNPSSSSSAKPAGKAGTDPDSDKFKQAMKKVEKVEKVGEVDLDQQRRRPTYKTAEEEEEEDAKTRLPTPFEPSFHMTTAKPSAPVGFEAVESNSLSTPPSSTLPEVHLPASSAAKGDLPTSQNFWEGFDLPDEAPKKVQFSEAVAPGQQPRVSSDLEKEMEEAIEKTSKKKVSPVEAPLPKQSKEDHPSKRSEEIEEAVKAKKGRVFSERAKERQKKAEETLAGSQQTDAWPPVITQLADVAQTFVASYLNPDTAALFRHMVGSIAFAGIQSSGISRTEILLNSAAFEKSPFYNSSITIEKFATAPDSFNILLSGSAQAVSLFNANIGNLSTAFADAYQKNKINFRIGRLETSYASNRSPIQRKGKPEGKESDPS